MSLHSNQVGSHLLVVVVFLAVVSGIGVVGYRVVQSANGPVASDNAVSTSTKAPAAITTKADIQKADAALDDTAIDGGINPKQLDGDIDSLL